MLLRHAGIDGVSRETPSSTFPRLRATYALSDNSSLNSRNHTHERSPNAHAQYRTAILALSRRARLPRHGQEPFQP
jgi:hypothetical protein